MAMNSWEEQALFEQYGWMQNLVARKWMAPDGFVLTYDDLMDLADEAGERALVYVIVLHGKLQKDTG